MVRSERSMRFEVGIRLTSVGFGDVKVVNCDGSFTRLRVFLHPR